MKIGIDGIDGGKIGTCVAGCIGGLVGESRRKIEGIFFWSSTRYLDKLECEIGVVPTDIREIGCVGIISRRAEFYIQVSLDAC